MLINLLIFLTGILAAFVGALVGGGGLISVPLLALFGLSPQIAIATNKIGGVGLCFGGISKYWKERKIDWRLAFLLTAISLPASYLGTKLLISIDKELLTKIVGFIVLAILPLVIFQKQILKFKKEQTKKHTLIGHVLYFLISIYSGFFGAGTGIFARLIFLFFYKKKQIEANATDLVPGLFSNILSIAVLAGAGYFNIQAAAVLFFGMIIGGYHGAHTAIKKGDEWVRIAFIILVVSMAIKLLVFS